MNTSLKMASNRFRWPALRNRNPATYSAPRPGHFFRVSGSSVLHQDDSASTRHLDTPDEPYMVVPGPVAPLSVGISAPPSFLDPFVHLLNETPPCSGPYPAKTPPTDREPPPFLLERLTPNQRVSFLKIWHKLLVHLKEISFDFHGPGRESGPPHHHPARRHPHRVRRCFFPCHLPTLVRVPS